MMNIIMKNQLLSKKLFLGAISIPDPPVLAPFTFTCLYLENG
jgi:hypothetical protein